MGVGANYNMEEIKKTMKKEEWENVIKEANQMMKTHFLTYMNAYMMKEWAEEELKECKEQ